MDMGFIDIVVLTTVAQIAVFAVFLAVRGLGKRRELLYLSLFFFSLVLNILNQFVFRRRDFFYPDYIHLFYVGAPFAYLYAPCFYLYLRRSRQNNPRPRALTLLHFVPFALFAGYLCAAFYFRAPGAKITLLMDATFLPNWGHAALTVAVQAQVLFYVALGLRRLVPYRHRLRKSGATAEKANFAWLGKLGIGLAVLWALDLLRFAGGLADRDVRAVLESALFAYFALFSCFILFTALRRPQVFLDREETERRQKKSLSVRTAETYKQELLEVMEKEKPHLEPALSLSDLSGMTGIPSRSLSEVIRDCDSDNFYDFVNAYRVKEFIRFLADPSLNKQTVLTLMFEAGFNSKSAFNKAFKKKTGKNPRLFIKQQSPPEK